ncbi:hypothetical protein Bcav_1111 [Beutenbergia cavernae DSM 12333]|uniref:Uncharacterized protein n=1 Tax=Beutenbergia cavernae (strain ATCC BAA-8 / DSM 12333 / CCUG 43141 / JCM 11478 / NBRC 16432 / NCIMB 13614 / HKI 0122) TaxID=471853 RepID=C5C0W7_BEUC1|nr:hypothetical protein Bcav_1111 [Beutenbergia cavernae DSM 12333]
MRRLVEAFGGVPVEVSEQLVGEPAVRSRRLSYPSGGEILMHDDAVVAVVLHVVPTPFARRGLDLSDWVAGARNRATFADLKAVFGTSWTFGPGSSRCFALDGGYARAEFRPFGGSTPGDLLGVAFTADNPRQTTRPEDDDCPTCSGLLVRDGYGAVDVDRTIAELAAGVEARVLSESSAHVRLADLALLGASGLMERAESQVACRTCQRVACFTLHRDSCPTFGYYPTDEARQRPLEAIPPVESWGDADRIAAASDAMRYVDHEPGAWFLVEKQGILYLDARYVVSSMADDSALLRLSESELEAYRVGGHDYLSQLARKIHDGSPHREDSTFYPRNLYRDPETSRAFRDEVSAAIVNHTWLAEHRRQA